MEITNPPPDEGLQQSRLAKRRALNLLRGLGSTTSIVLALLLVVLGNIISSHFYARVDWSANRISALNTATRGLVASLDSPLAITVFLQPDHEIFQLLQNDIVHLLRDYEYASKGRIRITRVDPDRHPGKAADLIKRHELAEPNVLILEYGDRSEIIHGSELAEIDYGPVLQGALPAVKAFTAEQAISSAISRLLHQKPARVYYTTGRGERDFGEHDPYVGLSRMAAHIRKNHIELVPLNPAAHPEIPVDAAAIIIAAPSRSLSPPEIERFRSYFKNSGKLLLLLGAETDAGFAPLLGDWGIRSMNNLIVDPEKTLSGYEVVVDSFAEHPITAGLAGLSTVFYWPRALVIDSGNISAGSPSASPIAFSSAESWAERNLEQRPPAFDEALDVRGPLPVAVAVELNNEQARTLGVDTGRAVVIGDAEFISNSGLTGANADFVANALNWLLQRQPLLDIAPRPVEQMKIVIEAGNLRLLFWWLAVVLPLGCASAGAAVWWRRRM